MGSKVVSSTETIINVDGAQEEWIPHIKQVLINNNVVGESNIKVRVKYGGMTVDDASDSINENINNIYDSKCNKCGVSSYNYTPSYKCTHSEEFINNVRWIKICEEIEDLCLCDICGEHSEEYTNIDGWEMFLCEKHISLATRPTIITDGPIPDSWIKAIHRVLSSQGTPDKTAIIHIKEKSGHIKVTNYSHILIDPKIIDEINDLKLCYKCGKYCTKDDLISNKKRMFLCEDHNSNSKRNKNVTKLQRLWRWRKIKKVLYEKISKDVVDNVIKYYFIKN